MKKYRYLVSISLKPIRFEVEIESDKPPTEKLMARIEEEKRLLLELNGIEAHSHSVFVERIVEVPRGVLKTLKKRRKGSDS